MLCFGRWALLGSSKYDQSHACSCYLRLCSMGRHKPLHMRLFKRNRNYFLYFTTVNLKPLVIKNSLRFFVVHLSGAYPREKHGRAPFSRKSNVLLLAPFNGDHGITWTERQRFFWYKRIYMHASCMPC